LRVVTVIEVLESDLAITQVDNFDARSAAFQGAKDEFSMSGIILHEKDSQRAVIDFLGCQLTVS